MDKMARVSWARAEGEMKALWRSPLAPTEPLTPFSGSPLPSRANSDSSTSHGPVGAGSALSHHTPSVMPTPCLQALHVQFPLPGMLRTHACLHMHMHTHNSRLTLKHPEVSAWTSPSQEAFLRPLGQVPPL